jgi:glycosyltransferase involved in cell wall biosynthesis
VKLTIVTETFPPEVNGVAMTFGHLARELARRGNAVTVCRPLRDDLINHEGKADFVEELFTGVPIPGYPLLRLGLPARRRLLRQWTQNRPDLVHVVTEGPLGASAVSAARALNIPVTSSFHTNFHAYTSHYGFGLFRRVALAWLKRVHNRTQRTFTPTMQLCAELSAVGFQNLRLLSRGVDLVHFSPARRSAELRASWGAGPDDIVVLHVGRMAAEKNYPLLFRAFAAMQSANPRIRCVLAGEGPLKGQLARDYPQHIFAGFFSREEIGRYYASADIYVHASLTETFGNVLTEAMASGLAVAGFDYAAARQFIQTDTNGLSVPCAEPDRLVAAAVRLATDAALRDRLRARARAVLLDQSWEKVVARFETDLTEVIDEHTSKSRASSLRPPLAESATTAPVPAKYCSPHEGARSHSHRWFWRRP